MKFKVGDFVKIREDLEVGKRYGRLEMRAGRMGELRGTLGRITQINECDYEVNEMFWWHESMLESIPQSSTTLQDLVDERNYLIGVLISETIKAQLKLFEVCFLTDSAKLEANIIFAELRNKMGEYEIGE